MLALLLLALLGPQQLLDRIIARVDGAAITLTDVRAALALGIVEAPDGANQEAVAAERLIDRQLMLAEVARFAPPEPDAAAIDKEVAAITARTGGKLAGIMESTGIDEARVREMARDTLRIASYLDRRFGPDRAGMDQWMRDLRRRANVTIRAR